MIRKQKILNTSTNIVNFNEGSNIKVRRVEIYSPLLPIDDSDPPRKYPPVSISVNGGEAKEYPIKLQKYKQIEGSKPYQDCINKTVYVYKFQDNNIINIIFSTTLPEKTIVDYIIEKETVQPTENEESSEPE